MIANRVARRTTQPIINDAATVERLCREHGRLVTHLAKQFRSTLGIEELIAEGNVGLVEAAQTYDPARGARFTTHAGWLIRAHIMGAILRESGVHRSSEQRTLFWGLKRAYRRLNAAGVHITDEAIAEHLRIGVKVVRQFSRHLIQGEVRLDAPAFAVIDSDTIGERMLIDDADAERDLAHDELAEQAIRALDKLSPRERYVIEQRFLVSGKHRLRDVGNVLGLSRERVRQIQVQALKKLRRALRRAA